MYLGWHPTGPMPGWLIATMLAVSISIVLLCDILTYPERYKGIVKRIKNIFKGK